MLLLSSKRMTLQMYPTIDPYLFLILLVKFLKIIIHKYIYNFLKEHQVITTLQSGSIPGDSTVNQLVDIYNTFCQALDDGKEVRAIFVILARPSTGSGIKVFFLSYI